MKTKKLLALLMAGTMSVSMLSGCGGSAAKTDDSSADAADTSASAESDVDYVKSNGKLVIGITDFAPMDYKEDGSDEWVGFDADMAKAFAESLGVKAEFIEINWDNKIMELDSKGVDAVWNGMTLTDEVKTSMNCSDPYATNAQVVVVPSDKADANGEEDENYVVGFRKGSDLTEAFNDFYKAAYKDGVVLSFAQKYGVQEAIVDPEA